MLADILIGMAIAGILFCLVNLFLIHKGYLLRLSKDNKEDELEQKLGEQSAVLDSKIKELNKKVEKVPGKVLDSITSSANNYKGRLGELIGWLKLNSSYDKIIPFGDITDFIAIRFKSKDDEGTIDFIDIKNGPNAKLTRDQSKFKKLIQEKRINFVKVKIDTKIYEDSSQGD